jgi:hypothetical protein
MQDSLDRLAEALKAEASNRTTLDQRISNIEAAIATNAQQLDALNERNKRLQEEMGRVRTSVEAVQQTLAQTESKKEPVTTGSVCSTSDVRQISENGIRIVSDAGILSRFGEVANLPVGVVFQLERGLELMCEGGRMIYFVPVARGDAFAGALAIYATDPARRGFGLGFFLDSPRPGQLRIRDDQRGSLEILHDRKDVQSVSSSGGIWNCVKDAFSKRADFKDAFRVGSEAGLCVGRRDPGMCWSLLLDIGAIAGAVAYDCLIAR